MKTCVWLTIRTKAFNETRLRIHRCRVDDLTTVLVLDPETEAYTADHGLDPMEERRIQRIAKREHNRPPTKSIVPRRDSWRAYFRTEIGTVMEVKKCPDGWKIRATMHNRTKPNAPTPIDGENGIRHYYQSLSFPQSQKRAPDREKGSPDREKGSPDREKGSPDREKGSPDREGKPGSV